MEIDLEKLMLNVRATGSEVSSYANQALSLASQSQRNAQANEQLTEGELGSVESKIASLENSLQINGNQLKLRMQAEENARKGAAQSERSFMLVKTKSVLEMLEFICQVLVQAAEQSYHKQRSLQMKVG